MDKNNLEFYMSSDGKNWDLLGNVSLLFIDDVYLQLNLKTKAGKTSFAFETLELF